MRKLYFDEYQIDLDAMSLRKDKLQIPIGRKTLDALLFLIENKTQVVSRETLRRYVWQSTKISASTIPMCIAEIRKALSDNASSPRFVSSIRGKGYRFIADIRLHADQPPAGDPSEEFAFVGRSMIIDAFQGIIRSTTSNLRGRMVSVIGEAGVGKSRLVSEMIHRVSHQVDIIFARTTSLDSESAFSIWAQILRVALSQNPKNRKLNECARKIASALPEISLKPLNSATTSSINRSSFFLQWSTALKSITRNRPLLVILEDLHQADLDSVLLLEYMAAEVANAPVIFLVTARPSLETRDFMRPTARILGSGDAAVFQLSPFTRDEVGSLIDPYQDNRADFATEIFNRTAGNAFYVTHLLHLWRTRPSTLPFWSERETITHDGAAIVLRQLSDLPIFTLDVLYTASAIGNRFCTSLVASMLNITVGEALERFEPALVARIIQDSDSQLEFCHALLRDSLYFSMSQRKRMGLHATIAEKLKDAGTGCSPTEVFAHLSKAFPIVPGSTVCAAGLAAGRDAISRFAYHEASRILRTAHQLASQALSDDEQLTFDLMASLASSLLYSGDRASAKLILQKAADIARRCGSADRLARCGLMMAPDFLSIEVGAYDPDLAMILTESLKQLPSSSLSLRSRTLSRLSQMNRWSCSNTEDPETMARDALKSAQESEDSEAIIAALAACADASHGPDRTNERIRFITELQGATLARSDTYSFLLQQTRLMSALLEMGQIRRIIIENERYRRVAEQIGLPQYRWFPASTDSMLACLAGNLDLADQHAARCKQLVGEHIDQNFNQTLACQFVLRAIERDKSLVVLPHAEDFAAKQPSVFSWAAAVAWVQWDSGKHEVARETLRQFSEADLLKIYREPGGTIGLAALAEVAARIGERSQVKILYDLIAPVSNKFATAGYGVAYFGSMARYAGLLAISLREFGEARRLTNYAVKQEISLGARSWLIYAKLDSIRAAQESLTIDPNHKAASMHTFSDTLEFPLPRATRCIRDALHLSCYPHDY